MSKSPIDRQRNLEPRILAQEQELELRVFYPLRNEGKGHRIYFRAKLIYMRVQMNEERIRTFYYTRKAELYRDHACLSSVGRVGTKGYSGVLALNCHPFSLTRFSQSQEGTPNGEFEKVDICKRRKFSPMMTSICHQVLYKSLTLHTKEFSICKLSFGKTLIMRILASGSSIAKINIERCILPYQQVSSEMLDRIHTQGVNIQDILIEGCIPKIGASDEQIHKLVMSIMKPVVNSKFRQKMQIFAFLWYSYGVDAEKLRAEIDEGEGVKVEYNALYETYSFRLEG